jgi:hypothetical protein
MSESAFLRRKVARTRVGRSMAYPLRPRFAGKDGVHAAACLIALRERRSVHASHFYDPRGAGNLGVNQPFSNLGKPTDPQCDLGSCTRNAKELEYMVLHAEVEYKTEPSAPRVSYITHISLYGESAAFSSDDTALSASQRPWTRQLRGKTSRSTQGRCHARP